MSEKDESDNLMAYLAALGHRCEKDESAQGSECRHSNLGMSYQCHGCGSFLDDEAWIAALPPGVPFVTSEQALEAIAAARAEGIAEGRRLEREAYVKLAVDRHDRFAIVDAIRAAQPDAKWKSRGVS